MYSTNKRSLETFASCPPVKVSFYFHAADCAFYEALDRHLTPLKRSGRIQTWDDKQVLAGQERKKEIEYHLSTDRILILLISSNFLASDECYSQMNIALDRHRSGDATVIPILVKPCSWEETELKILQILPREQVAISTRSFPEEVWQEVTTEIIQVIDCIQQWVFVVYAPDDEDIAEHVLRDLATFDIQTWSLKSKDIISNLSEHYEVRNAMRNAFLVLIIASPATASSHTVKAQTALATDYHRPILILWTNGEDWEKPDPENWQAEAIIDARAERYESAQTDLRMRLKQQGRISHSLSEDIPLKEPRNPYKGLQAFTVEDARDFFGREVLVAKLTTMVEQITIQQKPCRLLTVLGASGSGKSSVVMAGLISYLQQKGISDSQEWIYLAPVVPGTHPLESLATSLAQQSSLGDVVSLHNALNFDSLRTLHLLARQLAGSTQRKVVLFLDQFEEVFTLTNSEEERQRFFDLLLTAVTEPRGPLFAIITLRADFYDRPMQYPELFKLLDTHRVSILSMEHEDLRHVIEGPAQLSDVQISFEGDLVGDLLFEVREQNASLPLLQFTLDQLFKRRRGHLLTLQAYYEIGGVKGALVKHAEETYNNLSSDHKKLAQILFVRLIDPGTTQQDMVRRRAILSEFSMSDRRLTKLLRETMDAFINARLLVTGEIAGIATVEVSHEALIHEWPRCEQWIREIRENLPFQQTLSKDVVQWEQLGKPKERLYHGSQLKAIKSRMDRSLLNQQEINFLHTSFIHQRRQRIGMITMFLTSIVILGLVLTPLLVLRPSWCPSWLCPAPQPILAQGGVHDNNLQVTFQTLQSSSHFIPGNPTSYSLSNLPMTNDAQLIYTNQSHPFRVVLKAHSLQQGSFGMSIEQVAIVITSQAYIIPYPLHVWIADNTTNFTNNLYRVTYRGQEKKSVLPALYLSQPSVPVQLKPGETDELSLEVRSAVIADLHFQVQVTYQILGELTLHTLTLPNTFGVVFSDRSNWHPYHLVNGHLAPIT